METEREEGSYRGYMYVLYKLEHRSRVACADWLLPW